MRFSNFPSVMILLLVSGTTPAAEPCLVGKVEKLYPELQAFDLRSSYADAIYRLRFNKNTRAFLDEREGHFYDLRVGDKVSYTLGDPEKIAGKFVPGTLASLRIHFAIPLPDDPKPSSNEDPSSLDPAHLEVGLEGGFSRWFKPLPDWEYLEVMQIVNENEMLVRAFYFHPRTSLVSAGDPFWVKGVPTKRLVDEKRISLEGKFKVTGTKRYKTAGNASRTVYVVEPVKPEALKPEEEAKKKKAEADKKQREAEEAAGAKKLGEKKLAQRLKERAQKLKERDEHDAKVAKAAEEKRAVDANRRLKLAKSFLPDSPDVARRRLRELLKEFPGTPAAKEAQAILDRMDQKD